MAPGLILLDSPEGTPTYIQIWSSCRNCCYSSWKNLLRKYSLKSRMLCPGLGFGWNPLWSPQRQKIFCLYKARNGTTSLYPKLTVRGESRTCMYEGSHWKASISSYFLLFRSTNILPFPHLSLWRRGWKQENKLFSYVASKQLFFTQFGGWSVCSGLSSSPAAVDLRLDFLWLFTMTHHT